MAQPGSAGALGALGRRFESCRPESEAIMKFKISWAITIALGMAAIILGAAALWYMVPRLSWAKFQMIYVFMSALVLAGGMVVFTELWFGNAYCTHAYYREPFFGKCTVLECKNKTVIEYKGWAYEFPPRPTKAEGKSIVIEETLYYNIRKKPEGKIITKCWWE